jgi:lysophospholipase L1-like esterase
MALLGGMAGLVGCEGDSSDDKDVFDFGDNDPDRVVALGDSITRGYGVNGGDSYPSQLSGMTGRPVVNTGQDGERSSGGRSRVNSVLQRYQPGYLLVMYGANDLIGQESSGDIVANLRAIVQAAKANKTIPILATVTPAFPWHDFIEPRVESLNPMIVQMAKEEGVAVVDTFKATNDANYFQDDGLHPNASGCSQIAAVFSEALADGPEPLVQAPPAPPASTGDMGTPATTNTATSSSQTLATLLDRLGGQ